MVKDKINFRAQGPRTVLTRQTVQGRANDGGLRIGEMERDGIIGHGASKFLEESMMIRGDEYYMAVCNKTGTIAIYNKGKNLFMSPMSDGPIKFNSTIDNKMNIENITKYGRSFSVVRIPYSFKLLMQELLTMNIQMRIITEDNIDDLVNLSYSNNINKLLYDPDATPETVVRETKQRLDLIEREREKKKPDYTAVPPPEYFHEPGNYKVVEGEKDISEEEPEEAPEEELEESDYDDDDDYEPKPKIKIHDEDASLSDDPFDNTKQKKVPSLKDNNNPFKINPSVLENNNSNSLPVISPSYARVPEEKQQIINITTQNANLNMTPQSQEKKTYNSDRSNNKTSETTDESLEDEKEKEKTDINPEPDVPEASTLTTIDDEKDNDSDSEESSEKRKSITIKN